MSEDEHEDENQAIVGRRFGEFWGNPWNLDVIDEAAEPDIRFEYSMHAREGDVSR